MGCCCSNEQDALQSDGQFQGKARKLGDAGSGASSSREQRAAAAEARMNAQRGKVGGGSGARAAARAEVAKRNAANATSKTADGYQPLEGERSGGNTSSGTQSTREARAAAMEAIRDQGGRNQGNAGISKERVAAMAERREHDRLVGRAEELYRRKGQTPPIGLPSLDVEGLRRAIARLEA